MMSSVFNNIGLYWQALGGNNIDQISGHCYRYTNVVMNKDNLLEKTTIIVDVGKFDNHQALGVRNSAAAVPDIRNMLEGGIDAAKALFLTHSHPDHLNGIIHYIKAGYKLPTIYAGKYTFMILDELLKEYKISESKLPRRITIKDGSVIKIDSLEIEVLSSSHTCFDSFGFVIKSQYSAIYHTGDMKIDASTYFRKPTNISRIKELKNEIKCVVADFYGIYDDGFATKEVDTFKKLVSLITKNKKDKIFIPVYPTHPEMYIIAFLAALKLKKNVVFFGNPDFYGYLNLIMEYGINFNKMAKNRIKIIYTHDKNEVAKLENNFAVIGTYNHVSLAFEANSKDSFGIITASTYFNPLKGAFNANNIKFANIDESPELQGIGHGFLGDYEYLNSILNKPTFIPTHCPVFVIDNFRELSEIVGINLISKTPLNNEIFKINGKECIKIQSLPAKWLVVIYNDDFAYLKEVFQSETSGMGFLKRTISNRRCKKRFEMYIHKRKKLNGTEKA